MHVKRKQIRQAVKDLIVAVLPAVPIFTRRHVDAEDLQELVCVYFSQGEIVKGLRSETTFTQANLQIGLYANLSDDSDDGLDDRAELILEHLASTPNLDDLVKGFFFTGFEYPVDDEPVFSQLILTFNIQY